MSLKVHIFNTYEKQHPLLLSVFSNNKVPSKCPWILLTAEKLALGQG